MRTLPSTRAIKSAILHMNSDALPKENIEKDFAWQIEDRKKRNEKVFKIIQARSFEKAARKALYGADSLETYEESSGL